MAFEPLKVRTGQRLLLAAETESEFVTVLGPVVDLAGAPVDLSGWASFRITAWIPGPARTLNVLMLDISAMTGDANGNITVKNIDVLNGFNTNFNAGMNYSQYTMQVDGVKVAGDTPQILCTGVYVTSGFLPQ